MCTADTDPSFPLPCPFCGAEPLPGEDSTDAEARCISLSYEAWNRRPAPSPSPTPKDPDQMEAGL